MKVLFWLCLFLLLPGLLIRIDLGGAGITPVDILLPLFGILWLGDKIFLQRRIAWPHFILPGVFFGLWALGTFLIGAWDLEWKEQLVSFSYIIRWGALLLFTLAAYDLFMPDQEPPLLERNKTVTSFLNTFFVLFSLVIALGFTQFYLFPDLSTISQEGQWDPHIGRLLGTWMDPNFMAGFIGFVLPILGGMWYRSERKRKILLSLLILLSLSALFLTFSRSGYLAAALGTGFFLLFRDPKMLLLGGVIMILAIGSNPRAQKRFLEFSGTVSSVLFQDTDEIDPTAKLRFQSWRESFELFLKYPIRGIGFNTYRYRAAEEGIVDENYFSAGGSDSSLLTVLVTTGIPGLTLFLWFWGGIFWHHFRRFWYEKNTLSLGIAGGILSILIHSVFVNSLLFPLIALSILAVIGVAEHDDPL